MTPSEIRKCRSGHRLHGVQRNTGFSWGNVGRADKMYFMFWKTLTILSTIEPFKKSPLLTYITCIICVLSGRVARCSRYWRNRTEQQQNSWLDSYGLGRPWLGTLGSMVFICGIQCHDYTAKLRVSNMALIGAGLGWLAKCTHSFQSHWVRQLQRTVPSWGLPS